MTATEPDAPAGDGLALAGITASYGDRPVLHGVDLTVAPGQVVALLGPNGAGKTTLVGIGSGQLSADAGTVRAAGVDPRGSGGANRRLVGVAPQDIGVYPVLSVLDNLRFFAEAAGLSRADARARAVALAEPLLLGDLLDRRAGQLSGGQQRRLHAAIALVHRPPVVMLDEPTAGADPQTRAALLDVVRSEAERGTAVLYTTHYLPEVETLAADVVLLEAGRVIAAGPLSDLIAHHAEPAVLVEVVGGAAGLPWPAGAVVDGDHVHLPTAEPERALHDLLAGLGDQADRLRRVEVVRPSLEAVYLALTGRRGVDVEVEVEVDADLDGSPTTPGGAA